MCMYIYIYTHTESVYMYFSSVEHFLDKMELLSSSSSYFWATWRWGYFYIAQAREMEPRQRMVRWSVEIVEPRAAGTRTWYLPWWVNIGNPEKFHSLWTGILISHIHHANMGMTLMTPNDFHNRLEMGGSSTRLILTLATWPSLGVSLDFVSQMGGFQCGYPNSWMVYFMEHPSKNTG
jgi:hypothetical protein